MAHESLAFTIFTTKCDLQYDPAWAQYQETHQQTNKYTVNLQPWSYFRQQLHILTHFSGYSGPTGTRWAHTNTFSFLNVCSASPSLCRAAYLTSRNAIVLQLRSRQTCGDRLTVDCITSEWVIWVSLRVCEGFFFFFFPFHLRVRSNQEVWCCDSTEGNRHTMALCLPLSLVTWKAPGWRPLCCCCCCWPLWLGQVGLGTLCFFNGTTVLSTFLSPPCFSFCVLTKSQECLLGYRW